MFEKLESTAARFNEIEKLIADPEIMNNQKKYTELLQEYAQLKDLNEAYQEYKQLKEQEEETAALLEDPEMKEMAQDEKERLDQALEAQAQKLKSLLVPKDPMDKKNIIMEIRAGTGGDEAALFAADLYRMYSRYAEHKGWKVEMISANEIEQGGFKEAIVAVKGSHVYADLRYESGGHRVQRIPATESGGRIHTSAATVAVLPEAEEADVEIHQNDLKVDVFRSSGPGGQSVNTTDSAVRITHEPTGLVVTCQDEKSQLKNKTKAMKVLRSRLLEAVEQKKNAERAALRKGQVGSGDRSERIRTYNFPQNRLTDHRINLTLYRLDAVMEGDLTELIEKLKLDAQQTALEEAEEA